MNRLEPDRQLSGHPRCLQVESFDHPTDPLKYRYDDEWKTAESWTETIKIKSAAR